jgi:hypothetical protein
MNKLQYETLNGGNAVFLETPAAQSLSLYFLLGLGHPCIIQLPNSDVLSAITSGKLGTKTLRAVITRKMSLKWKSFHNLDYSEFVAMSLNV